MTDSQILQSIVSFLGFILVVFCIGFVLGQRDVSKPDEPQIENANITVDKDKGAFVTYDCNYFLSPHTIHGIDYKYVIGSDCYLREWEEKRGMESGDFDYLKNFQGK